MRRVAAARIVRREASSKIGGDVCRASEVFGGEPPRSIKHHHRVFPQEV